MRVVLNSEKDAPYNLVDGEGRRVKVYVDGVHMDAAESEEPSDAERSRTEYARTRLQHW